MKFDKEVDFSRRTGNCSSANRRCYGGKTPIDPNIQYITGKENSKEYKTQNYWRKVTMTYKLSDPTLEKIRGQVICVVDGAEREYESIQELTSQSFEKKYVVSEISSRGNKTVVSLKEDDTVLNDLSAEWAQKHMEETGREISFF